MMRSEEKRRPFLHPLAGARFADLLRILVRHGGFAPRFGLQVAVMLGGAILRGPFCAAETARTARRVRNTELTPPPIFIVGHWRSGTTMLHTMLSRDPRFACPTAADAFRPHEFFPSPFDFISRGLLRRSLPATRPMDNIPLGLELPQEDELAMAVMAAPSFLNCLYFPGRMAETFRREVLFETPDPATLRAWRSAVRRYLGKLQVLHRGKRLLIKNPAHGARIPELTAMFPGARFIHICREPGAVIRSTLTLYRELLPLVALQNYDGADITTSVRSNYRALMHRLLSDFAALPTDRRCSLRYEDLVSDPEGALRGIYSHFGLEGFDGVNAAMLAHAQTGRPDAAPSQPLPENASDRDLDSFAAQLGYAARPQPITACNA